MRALYDNQTGRIYCLVHGEKLPYLVAEKAIDILKVLQRQRKCMSIAIVLYCCNVMVKNTMVNIYPLNFLLTIIRLHYKMYTYSMKILEEIKCCIDQEIQNYSLESTNDISVTCISILCACQ